MKFNWRKPLKIAAWTLLALVLTVLATFICIVKLLHPNELTSLTNTIANELLDAEVKIGQVKLSFMEDDKVLHLSVDNLTILSKPIMRLPQEQRDKLPTYADTLATLRHFEGGINPFALANNELRLYDVRFVAPQVNIVILDEISSLNIYKSDSEDSESEMPLIRINRFTIEDPQPVRYHDIESGYHFDLALNDLILQGENAPSYTIDFGGNVESELFEYINLRQLKFDIGGEIVWDPENSGRFELNNFGISVDSIHLTTNLKMSAQIPFAVHEFSAEITPVEVSRLIELAPKDIFSEYGIKPEQIDTDLRIGIGLRLLEPIRLLLDQKPKLELTVNIPPSKFNYGLMRFKRLGGELVATAHGFDINRTAVQIKNLTLQGPATNLLINASIKELSEDPLATGTIYGYTNINLLPPVLKRLIPGTATGKISANFAFKGRPSMLRPEGFHRLQISGDVDADNFRFSSADSLTTVYVDHGCFKFGTNKKYGDLDSLLTASISIDSAHMNYAMMDIKACDLKFGIETSNKRNSIDSTAINPIGGGVKIERLNVLMLEDSTRLRVRGLMGHVSLQRYLDNARLPHLSMKLQAGSVSAGTPGARFRLVSPQIDASAYKKPTPQMPPAVRQTVDSLLAANPDMPRDSVYAYAIRKHRPQGRYYRQREGFSEGENEIIEWGTSSQARRVLLGWDISGSVTSKRAMMFTTMFPVRMRMTDFDLSFNNDSIIVTDTKLKAGGSDFAINGHISNIKRSFTSRGYRTPLKIDLDVASDSINVNELAAAAFGGTEIATTTLSSSDIQFEEDIKDIAVSDSVPPLLIPHNVDMHLNMHSNNIFYSDIAFTDFHGEILAARGALNMRDLSAKSDMGNLRMTALYAAPNVRNMSFGLGMHVERFNVKRFTQLIPAIDSIVPVMKDVSGIIDANMAMSCNIDPQMNLDFPSLNAAVQIKGDSLQLIDKDTYRKIGKLLMFKDKKNNVINHLDIEFTIADNQMQLYPRVFEIDRYKLGIQGSNDLSLNFNYHIAILKSPLPFKFGLNLKGNPDDYDISVGKARFNEKDVAKFAIADTTRVNLVKEIENVFRRGVENSRFNGIDMRKHRVPPTKEQPEELPDTEATTEQRKENE